MNNNNIVPDDAAASQEKTTATENVKRTPSAETTEAVRAKYEEVVAAHKTAVEKAVELGNMLIKVKDESPHGFFGSYIDNNFDFSHRTAQRFMKLAADFSALTSAEATALSHLTVEEATRAISNASSTTAGVDKPTRKKVLSAAEKDKLSIGEAERLVEKKARKTKATPEKCSWDQDKAIDEWIDANPNAGFEGDHWQDDEHKQMVRQSAERIVRGAVCDHLELYPDEHEDLAQFLIDLANEIMQADTEGGEA